MALLTPERLELQRRLRYETPFWAGGVIRRKDGSYFVPTEKDWRGCVKILDKRRRLVPCVAHPWQLEIDAALENQRAAGKPMRLIILKARKLGASTWVAVKFLQRLTQLEYQHAVIVAQDVKTAGVIFDMALLAHRHLPTRAELGIEYEVRPEIIAQSFSPNGRKFMQFGEPSKRLRALGSRGESTLEIDTAASGEAGRGYTPSMVHLSEVARWEGQQATKKMIGMLNAVPYEPETIVVLESTANGLNHFHKRWVSARDGAKDPDTGETYVPVFLPWWRDPDCASPFLTDADRERFMATIGDSNRMGEVAEDEEALQEAYGLSPEQLFWRRMMVRTQHENNVELFKQENPASDEEAFIGSGRTVFGGILIKRALSAAEAAPAPVTGSLEATGHTERRSRSGTVKVPTGVRWVPVAAGPQLEVWEHPRRVEEATSTTVAPVALSPPPTLQSSPELLAAASRAHTDQREAETVDGAYVVAVDVAEGQANTFSAGDFHAVQVFDHRTREQVAVHQSRMDLHDLPLWVLLIGLYYNRAWLAVEINGPGVAVVDVLVKDYHYPRVWRRKRIDRVRNVEEDKPGWKTDQVTKPAMEQSFGAALSGEAHGLRDLRTARELSTYVVDERGRHGALPDEHDDLLIAAMIAHRVMDVTMPPHVPGEKRRRLEPSDPLTGYGAGYG